MIDATVIAKAAYALQPFATFQIWNAWTGFLPTVGQSQSLSKYMQQCRFLRKELIKHNAAHSWWIEEEHIEDFALFLMEHDWVFRRSAAKPFTRTEREKYQMGA